MRTAWYLAYHAPAARSALSSSGVRSLVVVVVSPQSSRRASAWTRRMRTLKSASCSATTSSRRAHPCSRRGDRREGAEPRVEGPPLGRRACHSWLNRNRRILIRWSKKDESHLALLQLSSGLIAFKKAHLATLAAAQAG